ncbi:hypothetical protein B0O99DRAFT_145546 [Bisporella sp. PMI_857]|nr:hypothetical protein B0O99DRAFT_145546 [Bisporella sp. PMI_857]
MSTFLTDRIRLSDESDANNEPEDYLSSALGVIFPDDITNQHGDASTSVIYQSAVLGDIYLALADPAARNTSLFSHFVWNAAVLLAVFIEEGAITCPPFALQAITDNGATSNPTQASVNADAEYNGHDEKSELGSGSTQGSPGGITVDFSVQNLSVLELGAGTGLAGIVATLRGASRVLITDYPAPEILANIKVNVGRNITSREPSPPAFASVEGHEWGVLTDPFSVTHKEMFDRIIVADCLWMPHQHENLLRSIRWFLKEDGKAWVVAGFHTGREKMSGFFKREQLQGLGLEIELIWEREAGGKEREWTEDRGVEDITERKRWLVVAVLRRLTETTEK